MKSANTLLTSIFFMTAVTACGVENKDVHAHALFTDDGSVLLFLERFDGNAPLDVRADNGGEPIAAVEPFDGGCGFGSSQGGPIWLCLPGGASISPGRLEAPDLDLHIVGDDLDARLQVANSNMVRTLEAATITPVGTFGAMTVRVPWPNETDRLDAVRVYAMSNALTRQVDASVVGGELTISVPTLPPGGYRVVIEGVSPHSCEGFATCVVDIGVWTAELSVTVQ